MGTFWDDVVKRFGTQEDIINIPGAPLITNKYIDRLQRKALIPQVSSLKGNTALDIGTGIGRWISLLAQKADQIVGIDISRKMIKIGKKKTNNSNVHFVVASAYAIPLRSKSIDFSLSCTCLQHIYEENKQKESIHEITRVTKSRILILELMSKTRKMKLTYYPTLIIPKSEYMEILKKFGAKRVDDIGVDFLPLVKIVESMRNFILIKLGVNVPSYGTALKQPIRGYQILSVFALVLSLPLNKLLMNPSSNLTRHILLVAKMK